MIDADRLRSLFLAFFAERGHVILPSASLIPEGGPSVLFTTAGVHPLLPYLCSADPIPPAGCSPTARSACGPPTWTRSATPPN
jgi:alanyl-tRNA synthetase